MKRKVIERLNSAFGGAYVDKGEYSYFRFNCGIEMDCFVADDGSRVEFENWDDRAALSIFEGDSEEEALEVMVLTAARAMSDNASNPESLSIGAEMRPEGIPGLLAAMAGG